MGFVLFCSVTCDRDVTAYLMRGRELLSKLDIKTALMGLSAYSTVT